jgi:hypothetical protein
MVWIFFRLALILSNLEVFGIFFSIEVFLAIAVFSEVHYKLL